jgi:hypothetical protein
MEYTQRFYRNRVQSEDLVSFQVMVKETDLLVRAEQKLDKETRDLVFESRHQIESYIPPSSRTPKTPTHRPSSRK